MKYIMVSPPWGGVISNIALYLNLREDNLSSRRFLCFFWGDVR